MLCMFRGVSFRPLQRRHINPPTGIERNLTHYADPGFSRYLRRAFLASAGYDEANKLTQIKYKQLFMSFS